MLDFLKKRSSGMSVDIQPASRICICYGEVDRLVAGRIFSEHEDK